MNLLTKLSTLSALLLTIACSGKGNPAGPSTPPPPQAPVTVTVSGTLRAVNGGQALPGVQADLGTVQTMTDGSGSFSATLEPVNVRALRLTGASIVPRTLNIALATSRPLQLDAIALGGQFDLGFYRQFIRNGSDAPGRLQPLRRWTTSPSLYLQTSPLADARFLDQIEAIARDVIPQWTNHQFGVSAVERGPDTRAGQAGWLTVQFAPETAHCGLSDVGQSGGVITFYPKALNCACPGFAIRPTVLRHEFGHAMGYYHTDNVNDIMNRVATKCDTPMSPREAYHAAVAYNRSVGNSDPDDDPQSVVALTPMQVIQ